MYLHVGRNKNIRERDIIGIFDMDNSTVSHITRKYLAEAEKEERLISASDEIPKSFIVYKENGNSHWQQFLEQKIRFTAGGFTHNRFTEISCDQ